MHPWTMYALEVARDRERELQYDWLAAQARAGQTPRAIAPPAPDSARSWQPSAAAPPPRSVVSTTASPTT